MGRVTGETAYRDIKALLERGDFVTAEKLMEKFSGDLAETQLRELRDFRRSVGRRRSLRRRVKALRRWNGLRFLRRWGLWLTAAGSVAYIAFLLVWLKWLPPVTARGPARVLWAVGYCGLALLYFFFPVFLYCTKKYLKELHRWEGARAEPAEVLEIRREDRVGQQFRSGQVYHYETSYAVVRLLEPRRGEPETLRFYLHETANGRSLIRAGEEGLNPWSFHPGDKVTLYRDRMGWPSLAHHTRRSLTREWLGKMGSLGGWAALAALVVGYALAK